MFDLKKFFLIVGSFLLIAYAHAETFLDMKKHETVASIRLRNPGYQLESTSAPNARPFSRHFKILNAPVDGEVVLSFFDIRPELHQKIKKGMEQVSKATTNLEKAKIEAEIAYLKMKILEPIDENLYLYKITWTPAAGIPIETVIKKHGKPDKEGDPESHIPYFHWNSGLLAFSNEDKTLIYSFTFYPNEND